jgi:hypothetical protein
MEVFIAFSDFPGWPFLGTASTDIGTCARKLGEIIGIDWDIAREQGYHIKSAWITFSEEEHKEQLYH